MPETQKASVGYGGQFWLKGASTLTQLKDVTEFDIPGAAAREQVETTSLDSPDWRRTYTSTFYEDQDIEVVLNCRPMSDTDALLDLANSTGDVRDFKVVLPENGQPTTQITGTGRIIAYSRGRVTKDQVMQATATMRVVTVTAIAAYVVPGGGS